MGNVDALIGEQGRGNLPVPKWSVLSFKNFVDSGDARNRPRKMSNNVFSINTIFSWITVYQIYELMITGSVSSFTGRPRDTPGKR